MVPVRLRLRNFLSYGSQPKELDFSKFHIACLSGANGQGKSALLDAITWALWGKTERSRGHSNLARTGSKGEPMRVDFDFQIENARYRVVRTFEKESHKVELHHSQDEEPHGFRPLSGTGVKDTQRQIEQVVGLDYTTFINSAYLLQGRSNEFTRGAPGDRKEILSKILNLDRYERLREMASKEKNRASQAADRARTDIAQLTDHIDRAPKLKSKLSKLERTSQRQESKLNSLSEAVQSRVRELSELEAIRKISVGLEAEIENLTAQIEDLKTDEAHEEAKLAGADALILKTDSIRTRYQIRKDLEGELKGLVEKEDIFDDLQRQKDQHEQSLVKVKRRLEKKLADASSHQAVIEERMAELTTLEARRPDLADRLDLAQQSGEVASQLRKDKTEHEAIERKISACNLRLAEVKSSLRTRLSSLKEMLEENLQGEHDLVTLTDKRDRLKEHLSRRAELEDQQEKTEQRGTQLGSNRDRINGNIEAWKHELAERIEQQGFLDDSESGRCPTCGTELTGAHRKEVDRELRKAIGVLEGNIEAGKNTSGQYEEELEALRDRYRGLISDLKQMDQDRLELTALCERLKGIEERSSQRSAITTEIQEISEKLSSESFMPRVREELSKLLDQRKAIGFDPAKYDKAIRQAGEIVPLQNELARIDRRLQGRPELVSEFEACLQEADRRKGQLENGTEVTALQDSLAEVIQRTETLGFDRKLLRDIRQKLEPLSEAVRDMDRLKEARSARAGHIKRLEVIRKRLQSMRSEREGKRADQLNHTRALDAMDSVKAGLQKAQEEQHLVQQHWGETKGELGQITEQLQQIKRLRKERDSMHVTKREASDEAVIYDHLSKAFSRRGIPSLIIEQSVTEIEKRTNLLLSRLTDGRMRVQIQMLKEKKSGGTLETLDIRVNDELGAFRPYESYSGGEAFRINFALRIALSQLLAARSGVPVRTLVIDEGFGTQDQEGIENIVTAIGEVSKDFEKILIITHLEEVKDAFPVRIEVTKDPVTGSDFELTGV